MRKQLSMPTVLDRTPPASPATPISQRSINTALAVVMSLYFVWGSITALNDIVIPHLKRIFTLTYAEALLVQFFFFSAYFVFAYPSGRVAEWIGYKRTIIAGLLIVAAGALLFIPAAAFASFSLFLVASAVLAAGMTFLQVSANPYVSVLGPADTAAARMNLAGVFNSLGTTLAPLLGSLLILRAVPPNVAVPGAGIISQAALRAQQASTVKLPYLVIAAVLVLFAILMSRFQLPPLVSTDPPGPDLPSTTLSTIWRARHLLLGVVGIFMYVGVEVSVGSLLTSFISLPEIGHITARVAARYLSFYWGGLLLGRLTGASLLRKAPSHTVLAISGCASFSLIALSMLTTGWVAMWCVLLTGLFHSVMWPAIFTLAIRSLGPLTGRGSGLLIAGIIGGAIIPQLQGAAADHFGLRRSFAVLLFAYVYIAYYGFAGYRPQPIIHK